MVAQNSTNQDEVNKKAAEIYNDAYELVAQNLHPKDYVEMRRKFDGWGDAEEKAVWQAYNHIATQPDTVSKVTANIYSQDLKKLPPIHRDIVTGIQSAVHGAESMASRVTGIGDADQINRDSNIIDNAANIANEDQVPQWLGKGVRGASRSIFQAATLSPLGPYGIIGGFTADRANQAVTEAKDAGLKGKDKWGYVGRAAAIEAGVAIAFQAVGLGGFEDMISTKGFTAAGLKGILKQTGIGILQELPEENLTEILDAVNQKFSGVSLDALSAENIFNTLKDTTIQTVLATGATGTVKGIVNHKHKNDYVNVISNNLNLSKDQVSKFYDEALAKSKNEKEFSEHFGQGLEKAILLSERGIAGWATVNPGAAVEIAIKDSPSRKDFEVAGLPEMDAGQRQEVSGVLRGILLGEPDGNTQVTQEDNTTLDMPTDNEVGNEFMQKSPDDQSENEISIQSGMFGAGKPSEIKKNIQSWADDNVIYTSENNRTFKNDETGKEIVITQGSLRHILRTGRKRQLWDSVSRLPEIIKTAQLSQTHSDTKDQPGLEKVHHFTKDVKIDGQVYEVELLVKEFDKGVLPGTELTDILYHQKIRAAGTQGSETSKRGATQGHLTRAGNGSTDNIAPTNNNVKSKKKKKPVQAYTVISRIKDLYGITIGNSATYKMKKSLGWYRTDENSIRMHDVRNVRTATHELGHHIDQVLGEWSSKSQNLPAGVGSELSKLGKALYGNRRPNGGYRSEGFAEFVRGYLTNDGIEEKAPNMYKWFTKEYLTKNSKEAKKLAEIRELVLGYQNQDADSRLEAFMSPLRKISSLPEKVKKGKRWVDKKWRSLNLVIAHDMKDAGIDHRKLRPDDNPVLKSIAYSMAASGKAIHALFDNTTDLASEVTGESLQDALAPISVKGEQEVDNFKKYIVSLKALILHKRGINPGVSIKDAQAMVDKYQSEEFDNAVEDVTDWSRRNLQLLVDAGVMSKEEFEQIVDLNPIYVPFARQFEKGELRIGKSETGGAGTYTIKGSGREISDPIDALIWQSERIISTAMQADLIRTLVRTYDNYKKGTTTLSNLMAEVPAPQEATTFSAEQIRRYATQKLKDQGADLSEVEMDAWDEALTIFTKGTQYKGKENVVSVVIDGERRFFEVSPDMYEVITGLNKSENLGKIWGELSRKAVGLQRLGATGLSPKFSVMNFLRDTGTSAITFDHAKGGPIASLLGIVEMMRDTDTKKRFDSMGVSLQGWVGRDGRRTKSLRKKVTAVTLGQKAIVSAFTPIDTLRTLFGITEAGSRLAEFKAAYKKGMKLYGNSRDASLYATVAAKDVTVDFTRAGEYGRMMNEVFLFFNAGLQSVDKFGRTFYHHPFRTMTRGATYITMIAMLNYLRNRDEQWWQELPPYEKWKYTHFKIPGTDDKFKIPLPFEFGLLFGALPVAAIEESRSPGAFKEAFTQMKESLTPGSQFTPAVLTPIIEATANKDWKGSEIVPAMTEKHRLPKDQYTPSTTELMKLAGKVFGLSPAKLDHVVNGYSGGLYKRVAGMLDKQTYEINEISDIPIVGPLFLREGSSRLVGDFYESIDQLQQKSGSGEASVIEIGKLASFLSLQRQLSEKWKESRGASKAKSNEIYKEITELVRKNTKVSDAEYEIRGVGKLLIDATAPLAEPKKVAEAKKLLKGYDYDFLVKAIRKDAKRRGWNTAVRTSTGSITSFGKRLASLRKMVNG